MNPYDLVYNKRQASGLVGLPQDLLEVRLDSFAKRALAACRRDIPTPNVPTVLRQTEHGAKKLPALSMPSPDGACALKPWAIVLGRSDVQEVWLRK